MAIYKLEHYSTGLCLSVSKPRTDYVQSRQPVAMIPDLGTRAQRWSIDAISTGVSIRTMLNTTFGLNWYRTTNACNVQYIVGNEADTSIDFDYDFGDAYCIKLTDEELYLTYDGSSVYWSAKTGADDQKWKLTYVTDTFPPANHSYEQVVTHPNLHVITTAADNIKLVLQSTPTRMDKSGYCGVNGSFFDSDTLNVALQDGARVSNARGTWNAIGKGAIGWTGTSIEYYTALEDASSFLASGKTYAASGTWLQGGIALHLGDSNWESKFTEQGNDPDELEDLNALLNNSSPRTAMVANVSDNTIKLFIHRTSISVANFRSYIQQYLGISDGSVGNSTYKAIMLDGGGSTGMVAKDSTGVAVAAMTNRTTKHNVPQIVSLKNFN